MDRRGEVGEAAAYLPDAHEGTEIEPGRKVNMAADLATHQPMVVESFEVYSEHSWRAVNSKLLHCSHLLLTPDQPIVLTYKQVL